MISNTEFDTDSWILRGSYISTIGLFKYLVGTLSGQY